MERYDLLIVGGGSAGASGGMYGARLNLKTAMFATLTGGLITTTHLVENWPGIKSISGPDLAMSLVDHATSFGVQLKNEQILSIDRIRPSRNDDLTVGGFVVKSDSASYEAKVILIATGSSHKHIGAKGEKEFENRGVSYCALCDGAFYRNKVVAIVGSGDSAAKEALLLAEHADKVYVVSRTELHPEPINLQRVKENSKIELLSNSEVEEIMGDMKVKQMRLKDGNVIDVDGIFVAVGLIPKSQLAESLGVELNEKKEIKINRKSETNIPGVFAAGDVCDSGFKQAITGSAEAVTASYWAFDYIQKYNIVFE